MLENAKLSKLTIRQFGNSRQDLAITEEVKEEHKLGYGAGKWVKAKLPDEFIKPARKYAGVIRSWHYGLTCPWDEGFRLLADKTLARYQNEFANLRNTFAEVVFDIDYNAALAKAREMHNGTFDAKDYPSLEEFRRAYAVDVEFLPVPRAGHFTVSTLEGLAEAEIEQMRRDLESRNEERLAAAVENVWARLLEPVQALAAKLANQDAKVYRESLVENITDILSRVDALNITGDTQLTRAAQDIKAQLGALNIERLKSDPVERRDVAERAARILSQFGSLGTRKFATSAESEAA